MKEKSIGLAVNEQTYLQVQDLAKKEGWSLRQVAKRALYNYLRLRGYYNEK